MRRVDDPGPDAEDRDQGRETGPDDRQDRDGEREIGKGELDVTDPHHQQLEPSAMQPGQEPERDADAAPDQDAADPDRQRHARRVHDAHEDVAA